MRTLQEIRDLVRTTEPRSAETRTYRAIVEQLLDVIDAAHVYVSFVAIATDDDGPEPEPAVCESARKWLDANPPAMSVDPVIRELQENIAWAEEMTAVHHEKEEHDGNAEECDDSMCKKGRKLVDLYVAEHRRLTRAAS